MDFKTIKRFVKLRMPTFTRIRMKNILCMNLFPRWLQLHLRIQDLENYWTKMRNIELTFQIWQVLECTSTKLRGNVVSKWKSKPSAFQNTKNLWNRRIIRDVRRIFVLKLSFGVISRVFDPYNFMYACIHDICMHVSHVCVKYAWDDSKTRRYYKNPSNITNNVSISKIFGVLKSWGFVLSLRNNVSTLFCVCALQNLTTLKS